MIIILTRIVYYFLNMRRDIGYWRTGGVCIEAGMLNNDMTINAK